LAYDIVPSLHLAVACPLAALLVDVLLLVDALGGASAVVLGAGAGAVAVLLPVELVSALLLLWLLFLEVEVELLLAVSELLLELAAPDFCTPP